MSEDAEMCVDVQGVDSYPNTSTEVHSCSYVKGSVGLQSFLLVRSLDFASLLFVRSLASRTVAADCRPR